MRRFVVPSAMLALGLLVFLAAPMLQSTLQAQEANVTEAPAAILAAKTIEVGQTFTGQNLPLGGVDLWSFQGAQGQLVIITMEASAGNLDPYLELLDPSGVREAFDKDSGPGANARLATPLLKTGLYTIAAKEFDLRSAGTYTLRLTDPAHLPDLAFGQGVDATIGAPGFSDIYALRGAADQNIILTAYSTGLFKPYLELLDTNGRSIATTTVGATVENQVILRVLPATGSYAIVVSDFWGSAAGGYTLALTSFSRGALTPTPAPSPTPTPAATPTAIPTPPAQPTSTPTAAPQPATVAEALSSIDGKYTMIWNFENSTGAWRFYNVANPAGATITRLEPGSAYWISVTEDCILVAGGGSTPLYKGWNLLGWR